MSEDFLRVMTTEKRKLLNETLHDEIITDIINGDSTVLFEIIENLNGYDVYGALSDEKQEQIKKVLK